MGHTKVNKFHGVCTAPAWQFAIISAPTHARDLAREVPVLESRVPDQGCRIIVGNSPCVELTTGTADEYVPASLDSLGCLQHTPNPLPKNPDLRLTASAWLSVVDLRQLDGQQTDVFGRKTRSPLSGVRNPETSYRRERADNGFPRP